MNDDIKSKLEEFSSKEDVPQTTTKIRKLKHSKFIKQDLQHYYSLKHRYSRISKKQFKQMAAKQCQFIYKNYTNLFNRLVNDELERAILGRFIDALEKIENGDLNQHEASYQIGLLLKKIYVDQALRAEKDREVKKTKKGKRPVKITWEEYKKLNM